MQMPIVLQREYSHFPFPFRVNARRPHSSQARTCSIATSPRRPAASRAPDEPDGAACVARRIRRTVLDDTPDVFIGSHSAGIGYFLFPASEKNDISVSNAWAECAKEKLLFWTG
jgi:hypothetical protein